MNTELRFKDLVLEGAIAIAVVAMYLASCLSIGLNPLDRLGQVSGLASLGLRFTLTSILLITLLVLAARRGDDVRFERTSRYVCAAFAGLSSAMVAGGCWVALHGTPWGFNAKGGDAGAIASWAEALHHGKSIPPMYPPLAVHILHIYSDLVGLEPAMAMKHLEIAGIGAMGPAAYLSWRLLLRPTWALGIGCLTMFPLFEPYKPFPNLVLVVFIPLAIVFLDVLRKAIERDGMALLRWGVGVGVAFGILSLTYSGWFQWSAPGLFIATLIVFPWREGRRNGLLFLGVTAVCYLAITGHYMIGLFTDPHARIVDNYVYFDVHADPMYVAMWRNDLPGITGPWPPIGELGGANLFTILLGIGFGAAVALGRKSTVVITLAPTIAGAFVMRFYYARQMWATRLVQLYPRTTPLLLYGLMILGGFAVYWYFEKKKRTPNTQIGALVGLLFVLGAAGSATSDRYMPVNTDPPGAGWLAWNAHQAGRVLKVHPLRARPLKWERRPFVPPPPAIDRMPPPSAAPPALPTPAAGTPPAPPTAQPRH